MLKHRSRGRALALALAALCACSTAFADSGATAPSGRTIGYVLTELMWAIYQTQGGKTECPDGINALGPREQFEVLYPKNRKRTVVDTQLSFERATWYPDTIADRFPFHEAVGPAYGLNLDGKVGPNDFTDPNGARGIDNQLYRAIGCLPSFRVDGLEHVFLRMAIKKQRYTRTLIELENVHSLVNDPHVRVTIYRGMDRLLTDATGENVVPGGSQRIDTRWGASFMQQLDGEIVNGVLTTKPVDRMVIPWNDDVPVPGFQIIRDMRMQLKVSSTQAQGLIGGYADVDAFYRFLIQSDSTHHLSNGQVSAPSLYRVLRRLADAHPDPTTGQNTAISSALNAKFTQVYIYHPQGEAAKLALLRSLAERSSSKIAAQTDTTPQSGVTQHVSH
jgi:hypothetical protein